MSTLRQLQQQIAQLEKKAAIVRKQELGKVIADIKKQIAEFGLTAADLGFGTRRAVGAPRKAAGRRILKPKYRDPATGRTWNGHGKRPIWFMEAQEQGRADDLLIDRSLAKASPKAKPAKPAAGKGRRKAAPAKAAAKPKAPARKAAKRPARKGKSAAPRAETAPPAGGAETPATGA